MKTSDIKSFEHLYDRIDVHTRHKVEEIDRRAGRRRVIAIRQTYGPALGVSLERAAQAFRGFYMAARGIKCQFLK